MVSDISSQDYSDFKRWYDRENSFQNKLLRSLKPIHLVLFGILIFVGLKLWQSEGTNKNVIIGIIGGIIIIIIIASMKQTGKLNPIPENVIKIISKRELDRKVSNGEVPVGTEFNSTVYCKLIYWGGLDNPVPYRWKVGYKMRTPDNLEKNIVVTLNPFFGYITGIIAVNSFDGTELEHRDVQIIVPEAYTTKVSEEEKTEK